MAMRCGLRSAAGLAEISVIDIKATVTKCRRKLGMMDSLRPNQGISVFSQRQNLSDADLDGGRRGKKFRPLAGPALDRIHGIEADIETPGLAGQVFDPLSIEVGIRSGLVEGAWVIRSSGNIDGQTINAIG